MSTGVVPRWSAAVVSLGMLTLGVSSAAAQSPPHQHDMQHMTHETTAASREGPGSSWQPDETPMYAIHDQIGRWTLMTHGNMFLQYLQDSGDRGSHQTGSINWLMGMADRPVGRGHLGLRGMVSLEPWTIRGCGYPDLLASGEVCNGEAIHDRQHPHDLFMELAASYDRPLNGNLHLQLYGGPAGEPALGPVAFPHRPSAMASPLAPITHHWLDATHVTYGVMTVGLYGKQWKGEGSVFNGREPDETRTNFDFAALDSWSGRVWVLPSKRWAIQFSGGRLAEAEVGHDGGPRIDVRRVTASATYHRVPRAGSIWASTFAWGRNQEPGNDGTNGWLAETSLTLDERHTWFGRFELSEKSSHDLAIDALDSRETFTLGKLEGGYTRYLTARHGLMPGIGAGMSASVVPDALTTLYGARVNVGFRAFLTLRPAAHGM